MQCRRCDVYPMHAIHAKDDERPCQKSDGGGGRQIDPPADLIGMTETEPGHSPLTAFDSTLSPFPLFLGLFFFLSFFSIFSGHTL